MRLFQCSECGTFIHHESNKQNFTCLCSKWRMIGEFIEWKRFRFLQGKKKANNKKVSGKKRETVYVRDNYKCYLCGFDVSSSKGDRRRTIDHLIPRSRGGSNHIDNLATCCLLCNMDKGSKMPKTTSIPSLVEFKYFKSLIINF